MIYWPTAYIINDIPIWLYDVADPKEAFSVAHFTALARPLIEDIRRRGKMPIIVGGTGLYIKALVSGIGTVDVEPDLGLRKVLDKLSVGILQKLLAVLHPPAWDRLNDSDRANPRRLLRKIEVAVSDKDDRTGGSKPNAGDTCTIGLKAPIPYLDEKISNRVRERMEAGMLNEIDALLAHGVQFSDPGMTSLGYREWKLFFADGEKSSAVKRDSIDRWILHERQYSRRQMTWFRKQPRIQWFDVSNPKVGEKIEQLVSAWYTDGDHGVEN
jgi:tRNA dimethylallyltransferase